MKHKIITILISLVFTSISYSQMSVYGGMGLEYAYIPGISDYVASRGIGAKNFQTRISFNFEYSYELSKDYDISLNYGYGILSVNGDENSFSRNYELSCNFNQPTLIIYKKNLGESFKLRYGLGLGYHYYNITETNIYGAENNYRTSGFGMLAKGDFLTPLGESTWLVASAYLNAGFTKAIKISNDDGSEIDLKMKNYSAGIQFGIMYNF